MSDWYNQSIYTIFDLWNPWDVRNFLHPLDEKDQVANVCGSSYQRNNWKRYWLDTVPFFPWPDTCQIDGCCRRAKVGAHVYVKGTVVFSGHT